MKYFISRCLNGISHTFNNFSQYYVKQNATKCLVVVSIAYSYGAFIK